MGVRVAFLLLVVACGQAPVKKATKFEDSGDGGITDADTQSTKTSGKKAPTGPSGAVAGTDSVPPFTPPVQDGTWEHPFLLSVFPAPLSGDTKKSTVSKVKSYSCDPSQGAAGAEIVYEITAPADGTFNVNLPEVSGDGIEIDLYLLKDATTCVQASNDAISQVMKAGEKYLLVFDTWSDTSGGTYPGLFNATTTFVTATASGCPADMMSVPFQNGVCMDKYEAPNVVGQKPFVMFTLDESEAWCTAKGKRLCYDDEWTFACSTAAQYPYPWGFDYEENTCNADKTYKAYSQDKLNAWPSGVNTPNLTSLDQLIAATKAKGATATDAINHVMDIYQAEPAGGFPGCTNVFGVRDLYGGVEEWTRRRDGGEAQFHGNLKGRFWATKDPNRTCGTNVRVHADAFRFYEIGFRCCKSK